MSSAPDYVHGYSEREAERLRDQAATVRELLHHDTRYPAGSEVLEAGCGVGAQTITLARNSPEARVLSVDVSPTSLEQAQAMARREGLANVRFQQVDIFHLPFQDERFDHVFVCYLLEHLADPLGAILALSRMLKKGGTITVIEGDHGSCYYHPATPAAASAWGALVSAQQAIGGDPLIGRRLYPLVAGAGFADVAVSLRQVYADESLPGVQDGFVQRTIVPMVEGVREPNAALGLVDSTAFEQGLADLRATGGPGGTFCYTFFRATGMKSG